jgi:hypothetical protein
MELAISSFLPIVILYAGQHEYANKFTHDNTSRSSLFLRPPLPPQFRTRRNQQSGLYPECWFVTYI